MHVPGSSARDVRRARIRTREGEYEGECGRGRGLLEIDESIRANELDGDFPPLHLPAVAEMELSGVERLDRSAAMEC